jgi:hypothetical protein
VFTYSEIIRPVLSVITNNEGSVEMGHYMASGNYVNKEAGMAQEQ